MSYLIFLGGVILGLLAGVFIADKLLIPKSSGRIVTYKDEDGFIFTLEIEKIEDIVCKNEVLLHVDRSWINSQK